MPEITAQMVKDLRDRTGAPFLDCKNALNDSDGDIEKALDLLKIKGVAKASKKASRETPEGSITSYIHAGGKIGVLLEINCETDFVARNEEFQQLSREIAMQIAAANPQYVNSGDVPESVVEKEKEVMKAQVIEEGKKPEIADKIVEGKINKFFEEMCLLEQAYIREPKTKISVLIQNAIAKIGENIVVRRFERFQLGEPLD
ncbi:MAG: translation elongation factor Ts [Thermodesulfobacteriota bacterium]|jgi:elongation factor Ts